MHFEEPMFAFIHTHWYVDQSSTMIRMMHQMQNPLMEEIGAPSGSTLEFSTGIKDSFSKLKMNLSTFQDHMQLDGHNAEMRGAPSGRRTFCNTGHGDDMWEGNFPHFSSLLLSFG